MSESDLVARARDGQDRAWAQIIQEHRESVFRLVYLLLGNQQDAEDVTQETFIRAYRFFDQFEDGRPLRPWLMQIGRNLAANRRRSLGRYWRAVMRFLDQTSPVSSAGLEQATERQAQADLLWQAVKNLKRQDQEVIYLRYFLELSTQETAEVLEVAEGTVKSRLHRALSRLEEQIAANYPALEKEFNR